jgi:adenylate cyclase
MPTEPKGTLNPVGGGDAMPLIRDRMTMGRRESCDIRMPFNNVSSVHCELTYKDGYWWIKDLNSTNGIKVNGMRVLSKVLLPGDEISIAKRKYVIHYVLAAGRRALEEIMEDDVMSHSLLERAGLVRSKDDKQPRRRPSSSGGGGAGGNEPDIDWTSG